MPDIDKTIEELKRTEQFLTEYGFDGHIQQVHDAIELLKEQEEMKKPTLVWPVPPERFRNKTTDT